MGKFYWLKLKRDFFKRHDMLILASLGGSNGAELVLLFVKLMVESLDHEGKLRFSEDVPYTVDMLAAVLGASSDTMGYALDTYMRLGLVEMLEDNTYYIPMVHGMTGSAENNDNANRQRRYRESQKASEAANADVIKAIQKVTKPVTKSNASVTKSNADVTPKPTVKRFVKPTVEEIKAYCQERGNLIDAQSFYDFYESKGWKVGNTAMKDWKACVRTWEKRKQERQAMPAWRKAAAEIPYMQNEYTKDQIDSMVGDPLTDLDELLGG